MQIHLRPRQSWQKLNDALGTQLGLDLDRAKVACYHGLSHALIEVVVGLAKLYPLKKRIYYFKDQSFYFDDAVIHLAKDGYQVQVLGPEALKSPDDFAQKLAREDLLLLYAVDDPLFGEKHPLQALMASLADKNLLRVRVSHAAHFYESTEWMPEKNVTQIFSLSPYLACAILGERCRVGSLVTEHLSYEQPYEINSYLDWRDQAENKTLIETFEQKTVADAQALFKPGADRIFDRAIVYWTDMDASACLDRIRELGQQQGFEKYREWRHHAETPCLSKWGSLTLSRYCEQKGLSPEATRGLLMIPLSWLKLGEVFEQLLVEARQSVLKDQMGE